MAARKKVDFVAGDAGNASERVPVKVKKLVKPEAPRFFQECLGKLLPFEPASLVGTIYAYDGERRGHRGRCDAEITPEAVQQKYGAGKHYIEIRKKSGEFVAAGVFEVDIQAVAGTQSSGSAHGVPAPMGDGGGELLKGLAFILSPLLNQVASIAESVQKSNAALVNAISTQKQSDPFETAVAVAAKIREFQQLTQPPSPPSAPSASPMDSETLDRLEDLLEAFENKDEDGDGDGGSSWIKPLMPLLKQLSERAAENLAGTSQKPQEPPKLPRPMPIPSQAQNAPQSVPKPQIQVPSDIVRGAELVLMGMQGEIDLQTFVQGVLNEIAPAGAVLKPYSTLATSIKLSPDFALQVLRDYGFPVDEHPDWSKRAMTALREVLP